MPSTGRPAGVQTPAPAGEGEVKGVKFAGAGRGNGSGTPDVEVVEADLVVALAEGGRSGLVLDRADDVE
jgi:hypothetical protein